MSALNIVVVSVFQLAVVVVMIAGVALGLCAYAVLWVFVGFCDLLRAMMTRVTRAHRRSARS